MTTPCRPNVLVFLLAALLTVTGTLSVQADRSAAVHDAHVEAQLLAETASVKPGSTLTVGLRLKMDPKWHTYWINPGDAGLTTTIKWHLPQGVTAGDIQWPTPIKFGQELDIVGYGYEGEVLLPVEIAVPADFALDTLTLRATVDWLACEAVCIPGAAELTLTLPVSRDTPQRVEAHAALFDKARADLPQRVAGDFATAYRQDDRIILAADVGAPAVADAFDAEFFPGELGTLDDLAPQQPTHDGDRLTLTLTPSDRLSEPLKRLRGILVLRSAGERQAIAIDVPVLGKAPAVSPDSTAANGNTPPDAARNGDTSPDSESATRGDMPTVPVIGTTLWQAMFFALLGGMVLNLMPCVFPVLALKITGFVQQAGQQRGTIAVHGLMFGLGVLVSFWVIAAAVIAIQATGQQLGWGFQLQNPIFVGVMALLMFAVGLNFAGVFDIGIGVMNVAGQASGKLQHGSLTGSFGSGILATALATPCSAPFMTPAVSYALGAPPMVNLLVLTTLGLGMALPYVVLSVFPGWLRLLPKPGPWMESFKQFMAFPMFAVVIYLIWVFTNQTGGSFATVGLLSALLLSAVGFWALGRWGMPIRPAPVRLVSRTVCGALVLLGLMLVVQFGETAPRPAADQPASATSNDNATTADSLAWQPYSDEAVQAHLAAGRPVFVDFTADWCTTCKFNEKVFIDKPVVRDSVRKHDVALLKADWTSRDDRITQALARFGVRSVPLYVFFSPDPNIEPVVFSSMFSSGAVTSAIEKVAAPTAISRR